MLEGIRHFLARALATPPDDPQAAQGGRTMPGVQVAAAALLLELAHADGEFSPNERAHIEGALERHFGLDEATARELIELAEAERSQAIDHFQFTRQIAAQFDIGQKMVLAEVMWGVILADGTISQHESYLIRKIANLLELEPGYLAQARRAASTDESGGPPD